MWRKGVCVDKCIILRAHCEMTFLRQCFSNRKLQLWVYWVFTIDIFIVHGCFPTLSCYIVLLLFWSWATQLCSSVCIIQMSLTASKRITGTHFPTPKLPLEKLATAPN